MHSFFRTALRLARSYDRFSDRVGGLIGWLALLMVLVGSYNAVVRYLGRSMGWSLSSNVYIELQWYLFSLIFLLGASYTLRRDRHVRVDVFYGRLSQRGRDWVDLLGTLLLMLPFTFFAIWVTAPSVRNSWEVLETSSDSGGLARYPIKTALLLAFALLFLQGLSELAKVAARLCGLEDPVSPGEGVSESEDRGEIGFRGEGV